MKHQLKACIIAFLLTCGCLVGLAMWLLFNVPREVSPEKEKFLLEKNAFHINNLCEEYETRKHRPPGKIGDLKDPTAYTGSGSYNEQDVSKDLDEIIAKYNPDIFYELKSGTKAACVWIRPYGSKTWYYWVRTKNSQIMLDTKEPSKTAIVLHKSIYRELQR